MRVIANKYYDPAREALPAAREGIESATRALRGSDEDAEED
jgi:hypothetical protein